MLYTTLGCCTSLKFDANISKLSMGLSVNYVVLSDFQLIMFVLIYSSRREQAQFQNSSMYYTRLSKVHLWYTIEHSKNYCQLRSGKKRKTIKVGKKEKYHEKEYHVNRCGHFIASAVSIFVHRAALLFGVFVYPLSPSNIISLYIWRSIRWNSSCHRQCTQSNNIPNIIS